MPEGRDHPYCLGQVAIAIIKNDHNAKYRTNRYTCVIEFLPLHPYFV